MQTAELSDTWFYDGTNRRDQSLGVADAEDELTDEDFEKLLAQETPKGYPGALLCIHTAEGLSDRSRRLLASRAEHQGRDVDAVEVDVCMAAGLLALEEIRSPTLVRRNNRSIRAQPSRDLSTGHAARELFTRATRIATSDLAAESTTQRTDTVRLNKEVVPEHDKKALVDWRAESAGDRAAALVQRILGIASPQTRDLLEARLSVDTWADAARRIGITPHQANVMVSRLRRRIDEVWPGQDFNALLWADE